MCIGFLRCFGHLSFRRKSFGFVLLSKAFQGNFKLKSQSLIYFPVFVRVGSRKRRVSD